MRVLLAEDDVVLGNGVQTWLGLKGYAVDWFRDGRAAQWAVSTADYDLVLLDLGLPLVDGMTVLRSIRASHNATPVIVITARDGLHDRVGGLDNGADDYLVKPFEMEELAARMRSLERRSNHRTNPLLSHGELTLDPASMLVTLNGAGLNLSPREFVVLRLQRAHFRFDAEQRREKVFQMRPQRDQQRGLVFALQRIRIALGGGKVGGVPGEPVVQGGDVKLPVDRRHYEVTVLEGHIDSIGGKPCRRDLHESVRRERQDVAEPVGNH